MKYCEDINVTKPTKQKYVDGINRLISLRQQECERVREKFSKEIFEKPEYYRAEIRKMLGWPLVDCDNVSLPNVKSEKLSEEEGYSIYRMSFEILPELQMTGLFFKMNGEGKKPLVLVQHGGSGNPEIISGIYGNTSNYNDMLQRVIKYNVHAFAPQLLLWDNKFEVEYDRKAIDARLKRVGSSITAVELYGLFKILDYFESMPYVSNFGMIGMSYGGFYTLFATALDTRIKSSVSCAFFNSRDCVPWSDWVWFRSAEMFNDVEVACLVYPRRLCIEIAISDPLFDYSNGLNSFRKLKEKSSCVGTDWLDFVGFEGNHEFCKDDAPIKRLVEDLS